MCVSLSFPSPGQSHLPCSINTTAAAAIINLIFQRLDRSRAMRTPGCNRKRKAASVVSHAGDDCDDLKRKQAMASEGGEILRLKKEALAAIRTRGLSSEMKDTAGAGKKKKKKVVKTKVSQAHIDCLKEGLYTVDDEITEDELAQLDQDFRDRYAGRKVVAEKIAAYQRALLDQYYAKGFAEDETEVSDEEEEQLVEAAN